MNPVVTRRETHTYTSRGSDNTVAEAHAFLGRLPNGWLLLSLTFDHGGDGWRATVVGPTEVVT